MLIVKAIPANIIVQTNEITYLFKLPIHSHSILNEIAKNESNKMKTKEYNKQKKPIILYSKRLNINTPNINVTKSAPANKLICME